MRAVNSFEKVFIHRDPVDMRKGINGLCEIVQFEMGLDFKGRYLFVFSGRRKDRMKILYFDRSGYCLWQKRLEKENFPWPRKSTEEVVHISTEQMSWLLEGYDIWKMKPFEELSFELVG